MIAAFLERAGKISVKEVDDPEYASDEALVKIYATGICGSDLHYFKEGRIKNNVVTEPLVLGHETAGEIVAVGSDVNHLSPGDRVTIEPGIPCRKCDLCLTGSYNLCGEVKFLGAPPTHGTFREYINHKGLFIHKLPDSATLEEGALVEPLAVGYNAVTKAAIRPGERVLVTGSGPIGLTCMLFCRIAGAEHITITDVDDYRLKMAESMGADVTVNVQRQRLPDNAYNCVIEATGSADVYPSIPEAVRKRGRIVVVGMSNTAPSVDLTAMMRKEAALYTVYRYANCFQPVLRLLEAGKIDVKNMVSHRFPLNDIAEAFRVADDPTQDKMKIVIDCRAPD